MRHKWGEPDTFMDCVYSQCEVCGGMRYRERVAGLDYINAGSFHLDMTGHTTRGWKREEDTPRSCPGAPELSSADVAGDATEREIG